MPESALRIRDAVAADAPLLMTLIRELAEYERMLDEVEADEASLARHLFGPSPSAHAVIAEVDGSPIGFALYFYNFSTFVGKPGLYLEDLYVRPDHRGIGAGKALLLQLVGKAVTEDCGRMEWSVLDWNMPSIAFYESLGARAMKEWIGYRLDEKALKAL
jgi:GNAT superfamily N-acetyltransferase